MLRLLIIVSLCLYPAHLTSDRAWKVEEKGINYSSVSEHIYTCTVLSSSVHCFIIASINIFNNSGNHCHSKNDKKLIHHCSTTVSPNTNLSMSASKRRCQGSIACPRGKQVPQADRDGRDVSVLHLQRCHCPPAGP